MRRGTWAFGHPVGYFILFLVHGLWIRLLTLVERFWEVSLKSKNKIIKISCDGGASTGKSTGAKMISKKYNLKFLSSGLLYRYASFLLMKYKPKKKINFLKKKFKRLNQKNLNTPNLHSPEISK